MNAQRRQAFPTSRNHALASLMIVVAGFLSHRDALAQEKVSEYQEVYAGELPIILESPHGGMKDIPSIRPVPNLGGCDKFTLELTRLIRERMIERTGKSPEMVAMLANRAFIDVNRKPGPEAFRHDFTKQLYAAHYEQIDAALFRVKKRHGTGLLVLIHSGWNYPVQTAIGVNHVEKWCTIPVFVARHGWHVFHGPDGIGGHLFARGYEVPGFGGTPPGNDYSGIPITTRCRKERNIGIDGLQFEFQGRTLLADVAKRQKLAIDVADVLLDFVNKYYAVIPYKKAPLAAPNNLAVRSNRTPERVKPRNPRAAANEPRDADAIEARKWRKWTTADGKFTVDAKFVRFSMGKVTLEKRNGPTVDVSLEILCSDDHDFIKNRRWARAANKQ